MDGRNDGSFENCVDPRQRETETEREKDREQIFLKFLCVSTIYQWWFW